MLKSLFWRIGPLMAALFLSAVPAAYAATTTTDALVPNDTFYSWQWGMDFIHAPEAWATVSHQASSGTRDVVVAQIDGGMDFTHDDLKGALWTNPDEKDNGLDNDGDGLIGDLHGWNFATNSTDTRPVMDTTMYLNGAWEHGTAVASLIAGRGNNNIGMAGIAWKAKIMPLVILGADGAGSTERLAQAIHYAIDHRADIINMSLEGDTDDPAVSDAIHEATAKGILVVIAAGNGSVLGTNLDLAPEYPSCYQGTADQGVLVVSALQEDGSRNSSTNYGKCVNIAAPGEDILAARPIYDENGNTKDVSGYGTLSGTSLAAPLVSGVAALLKAQHPDWTGEQLASRILATVQPFSKGVDPTGLGLGVLDAAAAVAPASSEKYGPWRLSAANPGTAPYVWITDQDSKPMYEFLAGDSEDKRGLRAVFVRWEGERRPDILVTYQGDETGSWRVYRWDGVLLATGQVSQNHDEIKGGLLLASQDMRMQGSEEVLLTEANGPRAWFLDPEKGLGQAFWTTLDDQSFGTLAVGVERPAQVMVLLSKSSPYPTIKILRDSGLSDGASVSTTKPINLNMLEGQTPDGREVIRMTQSGKPTYLLERNGILDVTREALEVSEWRQAPLGFDEPGRKGRKFYDFWPR